MRTSLFETQQIDQYLTSYLTPGNHLLFESKMIISAELTEKVEMQKLTYRIIQNYGREKFLDEIRAVEQKLFTKPTHQSFAQQVISYFKK